MDNFEKEIQVLQGEVNPLVLRAEKSEVENKEDVESVSVFLKEISNTIKIIEKKRLTFTKPLNQSLKEINFSFKAVKEPLDKAKSILSEKVLSWRQEEQKRLEEKEAEIQASQIEEGQGADELVTLDKPETTIGHTQTRKTWKYKVTDLSKVPVEYKKVDEYLVNTAIRAGIREIPGLKIYQKETLAII